MTRRLGATMFGRFRLFGACICAGIAACLCPVFGTLAADLTIESPKNDTVAVGGRVDVLGNGGENGQAIELNLNGAVFTPRVSNGRWAERGLPVQVGANSIEARIANKRHRIVIIGAEARIVRRPSQKVALVWDPRTIALIQGILRDTLDARHDARALMADVQQVTAKVNDLYREAFKHVDVQIVPEPREDVLTVHFRSPSGLFGEAEYDCGNATLQQTVNVYVGHFASDMVAYFDEWKPMSRADSIAVRVEDIARALSRTAVHETGHALGLVGDYRRGCAWMDGCEDGHHCSSRYGAGWHIMDYPMNTPKHARLGEASPDFRSTTRKNAFFEPFSASYLTAIHPHQP